MIEDSKIVFITHPYYAVNNPTNNFRIYKKRKRSDKWYYIQCKNKEDYRKQIKEYIGGFFDYSRNEEKTNVSVDDYIQSKNNSSMFDYFMGGKKTERIMSENQMKREEMAMLKNGRYLLDTEVPTMQRRWNNYIEDSNIQMTVLSFYQDYIDSNINIKDLQKKIAVDIMPKFFSYCGYENPKDNLEWIVALHADRENNYHFHISWIEKNKCYRNSDNKLEHRIKLKLSDKEINFLKRQTSLTIERNLLYKPALIELNKNLNELQKYFNPNNYNFTLRNIKELNLEEQIVELGFLVSQVRDTNKKYIKYNSLPKNEVGNRIRKLTQTIKREIFKDPSLKDQKQSIDKSIDKINNILIDIDIRNNISDVGFESAIDNKLIQSKLEKNDTYILNSIVNHALYNFNFYKHKIKKDNFRLEDIINEIAYQNYTSDYKNMNYKKIKFYKTKVLTNCFEKKLVSKEIIKTLNKLKNEQDNVAHKFYEMFEEGKHNKLNY